MSTLHDSLDALPRDASGRGSQRYTPGPGTDGQPDLATLVEAARRGEPCAWQGLVQEFTPLVRAITSGYRLGEHDAEDVAQVIWLRLVEHLHRLREPLALPGWITTTAHHESLRLARGRERRPTAGILDTQSVRTGPQAGPRGYDAAKGVKGRKRVLLVDTDGLVQALRVVPASVQDRDTPAVLEPELAAGPLRTLRKVWADLAFAGERAVTPLARRGIELELVGRKGKAGFAVEPRRWKVEQTFGCLQRYRRLRVDDEASLDTSRAMTILASLFMTGMRLERMLLP